MRRDGVVLLRDEVLHEDGYPAIKKAMMDNLHRSHVDGLLLPYLHFYGSYDYVGTSSMVSE